MAMTTGKETGMMFKVSVEGLPDIIMVGRSPGAIKAALRKIVKQPSMINDVQRMPRAKVKKLYRDLGAGKDTEEVEESTINEISVGMRNKYYDSAKKSIDRAKNSAVGKILRGKEKDGTRHDHSPELKTIAKREKGIKTAKDQAIKNIRGELYKEEILERVQNILTRRKERKLPEWGTPESTRKAKKQTPGEKN